MADDYALSVVLLTIDTGGDTPLYVTTHYTDYVYDENTYTHMPSISVPALKDTGDLSTEDVKIEGIPIESGILGYISNHLPYSRVRVSIQELLVYTDDSIDVIYHFEGLLYQAIPYHGQGYMTFVCRDLRYYTDMTAGIPCTEQCAALYFGDKVCAKEVLTESHVVDSIDGLNLTVVGALVNTTPLLYNKGYVEKDGVRIKIKYHESGLTFQLAKNPPSFWIGEYVKLYAGCDRRLATCRSIHDNESRFQGLGYGMVDYNALSETT